MCAILELCLNAIFDSIRNFRWNPFKLCFSIMCCEVPRWSFTTDQDLFEQDRKAQGQWWR